MKDNSQKRVENIAKAYNNFNWAERLARSNPPASMFDRLRDKEFLAVFSNLDFDELPSTKPKALEIGIGGGRYSTYLANNSIETIGIDPTITLLKYVSERVNAKFIRASATDLPFKKDTFDLIICIELLHHFTDDVLERVLEDISEVIKPGGIFVFDVKNKMNPVLWYRYRRHDSIEYTEKARTVRQMTKLIGSNGFKIVKKKGILSPITLFDPIVIIFARTEG